MFVLFDLKLGSSHDIEVNDTKEGLILKVMAHHRLLSKFEIDPRLILIIVLIMETWRH